MKSFTVTQPQTLKQFTDSVYPQGSFALNQLLRKKDVRVNGVKVGANVTLQAGDTVTYYTTAAQEAMQTHTVLFENEDVCVVDKQAGVNVEGLQNSLCEGGDYRLVHRLDRNTAGVMIFAKNDGAERELLTAFRERLAHKQYLCLCKNKFVKKHNRLTAFLKKDERVSLVTIYDNPVNGSSEIITEYQVLKECGDYALVSVVILTGKTHQIRAHMAHIGCPVLGDEKYGDEALNKKYKLKRQVLVAKKLSFSGLKTLRYLNDKTFESSINAAL